MKKKTLGMMIASLRRENGMTQLELAEKMGITDKAVSKWEREVSKS
jgi:transcriptional regulator with XRE-family HTH domain